ncbi:MAG: hypothetical protein ABJG14_21895 [Sulfitobacter sp.]|uniref:hypothetical protein n=1 Tax=Alphaproteobacteria TaxID=28211 RepID=UPI0032641615
MRSLKEIGAAILAAGMVSPPLPSPPSSFIENRKPSGKNRAKVKAARKQRRSKKGKKR